MKLFFTQAMRLKTSAEFDRVFGRRASASDDILIVYLLPNQLSHPRLGVSVSKKIGNAVTRNRLKRLYREAFRLTQHELGAYDFVLVPKPGCRPKHLKLADISVSLKKLIPKAMIRLGSLTQSQK